MGFETMGNWMVGLAVLIAVLSVALTAHEWKALLCGPPATKLPTGVTVTIRDPDDVMLLCATLSAAQAADLMARIESYDAAKRTPAAQAAGIRQTAHA
jgi:hypothetical protein